MLCGSFYFDLYVCEYKCGGVWMDECCVCCIIDSGVL